MAKVNPLKIAASYLFDIPLEKTISDQSGELIVSIDRGEVKLSTANVIYSYGRRYASFARAFKILNIEKKPIEKVLILGFGLGSIVNLLEKNIHIQSVTAIDNDPVVLQLSEKYLESPLKSKVKTICSQAEMFMSENKEQFDLVLFDVFVEDITPEIFLQENFLHLLKDHLSAKGLLIFSKMNNLSQRTENQQFKLIFEKIFENTRIIKTPGNLIYCNG